MNLWKGLPSKRPSQVVLVLKNPPANVGDVGSVPGLGRSLEKAGTTHPSIPARRIPWTEEPGRYSPQGHKELDTAEAT